MAETLISPGVFSRENDISFIAPAALEAGAAVLGPTVKGPVEEPTVVTSYGEYQRVFGTTFEVGTNNQEYLTSIAVKSYFEQGGDSVLVTRIVSGAFTAATGSTAAANSGSASPFTLTTLGKGTIFNSDGTTNADGSLVTGSADSLRYEVANINDADGTFSLLVRRGDDNTNGKIILETFNDLSLDPNSGNYIERVIGNQTKTKTTDGSTIYLATVGEYVNRSRYIRVSNVNQTLNYLANDGVTVNSGSNGSFTNDLPSAQQGTFVGATGENGTGNFFGDITDSDTQGLAGTDYADAISMLENKDEYLFNIISAPGLIYDFGTHKVQIDSIISLAQNRGDAIAVIDVEQYGATVSNVTAAAQTVNNSYAATYWPWLQTQSGNGKNVWIPASTVIPGVYAFTDGAAAPWFAPAGLTRGGIPNVIQAERKLTRTDRDTLYSSNVNPIATFPGAGIAVFGQKTLQKKSSALDRVNVRRLLIELKKFVGDVSRNLVFEQNTIATRNTFLAAVNPYLESVVQRQGLYAFKVVMDDTNNTADVIDRNQLIGQIFIQPAKTVEYILLDFSIEPSGATFGA
jgi:phage tail sheath protein FI